MEVLTRGALILSEGIVLLVIVIQAASMYRKQRHLMSLTTLIFREGIVYFLCVFNSCFFSGHGIAN